MQPHSGWSCCQNLVSGTAQRGHANGLPVPPLPAALPPPVMTDEARTAQMGTIPLSCARVALRTRRMVRAPTSIVNATGWAASVARRMAKRTAPRAGGAISGNLPRNTPVPSWVRSRRQSHLQESGFPQATGLSSLPPSPPPHPFYLSCVGSYLGDNTPFGVTLTTLIHM
eukprot:scaffold463_cov103-Isochrysis_galbana.AAC.8